MNKKQSISLIGHLRGQSVKSRQFEKAIQLYAIESPFAFCPDDESRWKEEEFFSVWEEAADALGERFIQSPKNLTTFVERFGTCYTLDVFWNHVTALLDNLLNDRLGNVISPANPIFHLVFDHTCAACEQKIVLELGKTNDPNHGTVNYRQLALVMQKHRAPRRKR